MDSDTSPTTDALDGLARGVGGDDLIVVAFSDSECFIAAAENDLAREPPGGVLFGRFQLQ